MKEIDKKLLEICRHVENFKKLLKPLIIYMFDLTNIRPKFEQVTLVISIVKLIIITLSMNLLKLRRRKFSIAK